ncbi:MAG: J domain-containing protein [Pleurocapsa minor GSE-CHR-MK-17-07R]|nr:J domain-containing protein [Pleurocapsa minor GSE-CHR-MK 17-07R]
MKQFVLDHLEQQSRNTTRVSVVSRETTAADLLLEVPGGRRVAIYVVNRAIRVPEISAQIERNTRQHIGTLYILDGRMMPGDEQDIVPAPWMSTLHALAHGRLYGYWCSGSHTTIRPVHLHWRWGGSEYGVSYGDAVDVAKLNVETSSYTSKLLTGRYAAGFFGEGQFWKQTSPMQEAEYQNNWRNWSFGGRRRTQSQTDYETPASSNPWEEFERHYGDMGAKEQQQYRQGYHSQQQSRGAPRRVQSLLLKHYATLGLGKEASPDEVRRAYKRMARENHPDMHPNEKEKYTRRMADINAAFDALSKQNKTDKAT